MKQTKLAYGIRLEYGNQSPQSVGDLLNVQEVQAAISIAAAAMGADPALVIAAISAVAPSETKVVGEEHFASLHAPAGHRVVAAKVTCITGNPNHYQIALYDAAGRHSVELYYVLQQAGIGGPGRDLRAIMELWSVDEAEYQNLLGHGLCREIKDRLEIYRGSEAPGVVFFGDPANLAAHIG